MVEPKRAWNQFWLTANGKNRSAADDAERHPAATQSLSNVFEVVNTRLAAPVVRARPEDRLGLLVLRFLHDSNTKTASLPFGLLDGSFAIYPTDTIPPVYLVPTSRQTTLLYLPLLFHEFGHLLYARYKAEMDELVRTSKMWWLSCAEIGSQPRRGQSVVLIPQTGRDGLVRLGAGILL